MKVLVLGASGATGKYLVKHLLEKGHEVVAIVRSLDSLRNESANHSKLKVYVGTALDMAKEDLQKILLDCDAVASCLGHNLSFKGLYGRPWMLVRDSVRRVCKLVQVIPEKKIRFVLMNTSGNRNGNLHEPVSFGQHMVLFLLRLLLPPHLDNERAADYLRVGIGKHNSNIEWVVVRPDTLIDSEEVSEYENFPSPIRSAIFDAGTVSRTNVAHFMMSLLDDAELWEKWRGQMPLVYNKE
ncbi:MAG: NAD(P)-binding oxidoreductase [Spirochaetota bacterium]